MSRVDVPYEISIKTSSKRGSGTDADVFVHIYGPDGDTGKTSLCQTKEERKKRFEDDQLDTFVIELPDVGNEIEKLRIGHDNSGFGPGWHLDYVEVRKFATDPNTGKPSTTDKLMWHFPCDKWFDKKEDDGKIIRDLVPSKVEVERVGRGGEVQQREHVISEHDKVQEKRFKIRTFTGDVSGAGSDANVLVTFYGETSDTGELKLDKSQHFNKFERGQMDEFDMKFLDFGIPVKCKIRQDNSSLLKSAWYLDKVELEDLQAGRTYVFPCEKWLSSRHDDKKIERVLWEKNYDGDRFSIASSKPGSRFGSQLSLESGRSRLNRQTSLAISEVPEGPLLTYKIIVRTGNQRDAGTKANAWVRFFGLPAQTSRRQSMRPSTPENMIESGRIFLDNRQGFASGSTEEFTKEGPDVGEIREVEIGHDGSTPGSGWFIDDVMVEVPTRGSRFIIPVNDWLSKEHGDGKTSRIFPVEGRRHGSVRPSEFF